MRLSIPTWFYTKSVIFLLLIFCPVSQLLAYGSSRVLIGYKASIGGVALPTIEQYATKNGYKHVTTPFCHLELGGDMCVEHKSNYMSLQGEVGYRYMCVSFKGKQEQDTITQPITLHCNCGVLSSILYVYPMGRHAEQGTLSGHIGLSVLVGGASKGIAANLETEKKDKFSILSPGPVLGVGFEFTSGLQLEARYSWLWEHLKSEVWEPKSKLTTALHGIALRIGYVFK